MKEELLWSLIGGVTATIFNIIYNYIRENRSRRWTIAAEVCGVIDFYYHRLVKAGVHLESVFEDQKTALSAEEWRQLKTEIAPIFTDEQKIRAQIDIVYGVDSYESNQFNEVSNLMRDNLALALSIESAEAWKEKKKEFKDHMNQIARIRPNYRKKLVNKAKLWPILRSKVN
jgi:hypothetical protein